ncbi:MAG: M48 family metallopeptidase [Actinomycetales bacterium]|nr:M48 family metallopeptidase [Actinomycetales bacterium]
MRSRRHDRYHGSGVDDEGYGQDMVDHCEVAGQRIEGLPEGVVVRRSARRSRTIAAHREAGAVVLTVPLRSSRAEILSVAADLLARIDARRPSGRGDDQLLVRARQLSADHLDGVAQPESVSWSSRQRSRWGSCTTIDGTIRLSDRLRDVPDFVLDYVLLHELAHLVIPHHGADFDRLLIGYPLAERAEGFLRGLDHAAAFGTPSRPAD